MTFNAMTEHYEEMCIRDRPYIHFLVLCLYSALLMQLPFITFDTPNSDHLSLSLVSVSYTHLIITAK